MSSPPPSANPSPLAIGRTFLKQFYHVLTTTPDMIYKFYNPSSVLSHGEGSNPTTPTTMESLKDPKDLKDRFFSWAANPEDPVRFELEHGAIDAQESINGGVLLVVTGHMYLGEDTRRPFCHTFFLHPFSPPNSTKRSYYVHNDILRFLQVDSTSTTVPISPRTIPLDAHADADAVEVAAKEEEETVPLEESAMTTAVQLVEETKHDNESMMKHIQEEPVEETKEEPIAEETVEVTNNEVVAVNNTKAEDMNKQRKAKGKKNGKAEQSPVSPKVGSWASLVASSAEKPLPSPAPVTVTLPLIPAVVPYPADEPTPPVVPVEIDLETLEPLPSKSTSEHVRRYRRDPDNTLVIKNVPDGAKEADIRALFEHFANVTNAKVVGITVSAHRGLAFVDYDSSAPVVAALESPDRPFSLSGRVLDLEQKTMDVQRRAARGGVGGSSGRNFLSNHNRGGTGGENGARTGSRGGPRRASSGAGREGRGNGDRGSGNDRGSARGGDRSGR